MTLKVFILGSGGAAQKHRAVFSQLPSMYDMVSNYDDADVIDVCTPNCLHFEQARDALLAHKHTIVEKPVAGSLAEIDEMIALEVMTGKRVCPIFQYRFSDHDFVSDTVHSYWSRDPSYWSGWRGAWSTALGGCLTSHGIHLVDLLLQKHRAPLEVYAGMDATAHSVERSASVSLRWADGFSSLRVEIGPYFPSRGFILGDPYIGYVTQFPLVHKALATGDPLPVTLLEARQVHEVLTAAYYSACNGPSVMLPIEPDHPFYQGWSRHFAQQSQPSPVSH